MEKIRFMASSSKHSGKHSHTSSDPEVISLISDSDELSQTFSPKSETKKNPSFKDHPCKKACSNEYIPFCPEDMHKFWGTEQEKKFQALKN